MALTLKIEARGMAPQVVRFENLPPEVIYLAALAVCQEQIRGWDALHALHLHDLCVKGYIERGNLKTQWFWPNHTTLVTVLP